MSEELLGIRGLRTHFFTEDGVVRAVDGVDLKIGRREAVGLIGESGCGKSVTALSIMGLIPSPGRIAEGEIWFEDENLLKKSEAEMRRIRGNRISMIFQEPMSSLNPVLTVGEQIAEAIRLHQGLSSSNAKRKAVEMLELVGISSSSTRVNEYPHQLSGGMRQRVMIAMALSCNPSLLIADEPTTALDVTIQAQILELMKNLIKDFGSSLLLITHDFGVIAEVCDKIAVMYAGSIVECVHTKSLFKNPRHPYTRGLLNSIPRIDVDAERLENIDGTVPNLANPPAGCKFHPRCLYTKEICSRQSPSLAEVVSGHLVSCLMYKKVPKVSKVY
ncbi:ABC transporter ATP-binding protein [Thermodesulfovibrionales bacterium]|nr:ABC transporter ATP-binding protein [Thermodesulfovibrionales bacterium]